MSEEAAEEGWAARRARQKEASKGKKTAHKRRLELKVAAEGMGGLAWEGQAWKGGALAKEWLRSKANSIEGGTSEVQLGILAKNVLGMK